MPIMLGYILISETVHIYYFHFLEDETDLFLSLLRGWHSTPHNFGRCADRICGSNRLKFTNLNDWGLNGRGTLLRKSLECKYIFKIKIILKLNMYYPYE